MFIASKYGTMMIIDIQGPGSGKLHNVLIWPSQNDSLGCANAKKINKKPFLLSVSIIFIGQNSAYFSLWGTRELVFPGIMEDWD